MNSSFLPEFSGAQMTAILQGNDEQLLEALAQPLHEELYRQQSFDFLDRLSQGQQLLLLFDYLRNNMSGGGIIQLLHNGYAGLLVDMPGWFHTLGAPLVATLVDDMIGFYLKHREQLDARLFVQEFARLYEALPEAEQLDQRFREQTPAAIRTIAAFVRANPGTFFRLVP